MMKLVLKLSGALSIPKDEIMKMQNKDPLLLQAIELYKKELFDENIEVFEEIDNILITEKGYYCMGFLEDFEV